MKNNKSMFNMRTIRYITSMALELQRRMPAEIVEDWVDRDISQRDIVKKRKLVDVLEVVGKDLENTATSAVRNALYGFDGMGDINSFPGLVERELYNKISKKHRGTGVIKYNSEVENGFGTMDKDTLKDVSTAGVLGRGRTPVGDEEKDFSYNCSIDPDYIDSKKGIDWTRIRAEGNEKFGNNRTERAFTCMAYKVSKERASKNYSKD